MALSLADELAGAFDGPGGGMGQSLAEEFGLGMDDIPDMSDESNRNGEEGDSTKPRETLGNGDNHLNTAPEPLHDQLFTSASPHRKRPQKGSKDSATTNGTSGAESVGIVDDELDHVLTRTDDLSLEDWDTPENGVDHGVQASGSGSGFLGRSLEKDPIVMLKDVLESTSQFRAHLAGLDKGDSTSNGETIESRLQSLLDRLNDSDRVREEQFREVGILIRESGTVNWEGIDILGTFAEEDVGIGGSKASGVGLGILSPQVTVDSTEENIGWTGDSRSNGNGSIESPTAETSHERQGYSVDDRTASTSVDAPWRDEHDLDRLLEDPEGSDARDRMCSTERTRHDSMRTNATVTASATGTGESSSRPRLPRETHELIRSSVDLVSTLSSLSETVHSTASHATATARRLRGIKAGVDSWREREAQEDAARIGIDGWERKKLKAGLGGGERTKDMLEREMREFRNILDISAERVAVVRVNLSQCQRWRDVLV